MAFESGFAKAYCIQEYVRPECRTAECDRVAWGMGDALGNRSIIGSAMFGPPTPTCLEFMNALARYLNQLGIGVRIIVNVRDEFSVASFSPVLRAEDSPRFSVVITRSHS